MIRCQDWLGISLLVTLLAGPACQDGQIEPEEDLCLNVRCSGHGFCALVDDQPTCVCEADYHAQDLNCINDLDPCAGVACSNHGTCVLVNDLPTCDCDLGYTADELNCTVLEGLCAGVVCSGHGRCVPVDGVATCACDPDYYRRDLACLADPCEFEGTCYYVDADGGNDSNPGTRDQAWRSIDRVEDAMGDLGPGDYVLFRRDRSWTATATLDVRGIHGAPGRPITFAAYGQGARPKFKAIRPDGVSHVTFQYLESVGSDGGPCINVSRSSYVTLWGIHAHDCANNGLHYGTASEYGVMIDNRVWDIPANDALVVHSPSTVNDETRVRDHFWIVDNVVPGNIAEQPVDIATGNDDFDGSRDLKIVGNVLTGGGNGCIAIGHGSSVAWLVGNIIGNCTRTETAWAIGIGGTHRERSGNHFRVVGNVVFHNLMSSIQINGEDPSITRAFIQYNTLVNAIGRRATIRSSIRSEIVFEHNIVWPTGGQAHVQLRAIEDVEAMNDNFYLPSDNPDCRILGQSLDDWSANTGFDTRSSCAAIAGIEEPSIAEAADADTWKSAEFLSHFIPDASWQGCADPSGAFDCDGQQHIEFLPFANYDDNDGYGWEGPLAVRQRYPMR